QSTLGPGQSLPPLPAPGVHISIPSFPLRDCAPVFQNLPPPVQAADPMTMEALGQGYGWVLYRTRLPAHPGALLKVPGIRDYALVFVDGKRVGIINRMKGEDSLELPGSGPSNLGLFVENLGRINYGSKLRDNHKGIIGPVLLSGAPLKGWKMYRFPFDHPEKFPFRRGQPVAADQPQLRRGEFQVRDTGDTFLDMRGWGKGAAWVNGHPLGRYWNIGPQQTLYVPGCWLRKGTNTLILLETLDGKADRVELLDHPILDQLGK
ncbi:MAG TPA: hypothetical protein VMV20_03535, partial [Chitinophagaceae bacterium]|nr:hypothetical protein [Chitinophagaceae bacterium]